MFAHDTSIAIRNTADLVNTQLRGRETLQSVTALNRFLSTHEFAGRRQATRDDLTAVLSLRPRLRAAWQASSAKELAALANQLLQEADASPWLSNHDDWDWHLHVTHPGQPLVQRISAQAGMAFADVIRLGAISRLRTCAANDCDAVFVDLSRNHSRIYCDSNNCGNRVHVAAYRARLAERQR